MPHARSPLATFSGPAWLAEPAPRMNRKGEDTKMLRKSCLQVLALAGLMLAFTARDAAQTAGPRAADHAGD